MSEMIERVARAICRAGICGPRAHIEEQVNLHWRKFELEARAALSALEVAGYVVVPREATEVMLDAISDAANSWDIGEDESKMIFQAVIKIASEGK